MNPSYDNFIGKTMLISSNVRICYSNFAAWQLFSLLCIQSVFVAGGRGVHGEDPDFRAKVPLHPFSFSFPCFQQKSFILHIHT